MAIIIRCSRCPKFSFGSTMNRNSSVGGTTASVSGCASDGTTCTSLREARNEAAIATKKHSVNQVIAVQPRNGVARDSSSGIACSAKTSGRFTSMMST